MIIYKRVFLLLLIWLWCGANALVFAQIEHHIHHPGVQHPVFQAIDEARIQGNLTKEQAIIQKFRYAYQNNRDQWMEKDKEHPPVKCMVPVKQEYLSAKNEFSAFAVAEIEGYLTKSRSETASSYISPSGNFIIYYETEGPNAVPPEKTIDPNVPDYVYKAAFAADSSYRYQVEQAGFTDFRRTNPYEISFQNFGFFGTTTESGATTHITLHNNFEGFPPNTHPDGDVIGALYVTIAHEIKHAVQFAANRWKGEASNPDWSEMDATLMEEIVFPDVNDYYNYVMNYIADEEDGQIMDWDRNSPHFRSIFGNPGSPTPGLYWHVTWMLYFAESYGIDFWVDVWEQIRLDFLETGPNANSSDYISFFDAINLTLSDRGASLPLEHVTNLTWHLASGPDFAGYEFGFEDRENYPNPRFNRTLTTIPGNTGDVFLRSMGAHFVYVTPSNVALGQPEFTVESTVPGVGLGIVGYFRDGTTLQEFAINPNATTQSIQTTWSWSDLADISVAVVNTNRVENTEYQLTISSILPEEDMLAQNYPNPFNPTTRIEFSLSQDKDVRIDVYDSVGRKIKTLVDEQLNRGFHSVTFDGSGLASGIYFYRIITDQAVSTNKMMLIK